ncbi:hypothetical protein Bca4012_052000 [Brassica carinata]
MSIVTKAKEDAGDWRDRKQGECAKAVTRLGSSNETEAEALKWAASMIASFQYKNVVFETDSLTLTRMGNGDEVWPMLQPTIAVIHHYLSQVQNWKMSYNPRGRQLTG